MKFNLIFKKKKDKKEDKPSYLQNDGTLKIKHTLVPPQFINDEPNHVPRWEENLYSNKIYLQ